MNYYSNSSTGQGILIQSSNVIDLSNTRVSSQCKRGNTPRQPLLIIRIDLGGDNSEDIALYEGEDPKNIAKEFAERHHLAQTDQQILLKKLQEELKSYQLKKEAQKEQLRQKVQKEFEGELQKRQSNNTQQTTRKSSMGQYQTSQLSMADFNQNTSSGTKAFERLYKKALIKQDQEKKLKLQQDEEILNESKRKSLSKFYAHEQSQNNTYFLQSQSFLNTFLGNNNSSGIAYTGNPGDRLYVMQMLSKPSNPSTKHQRTKTSIAMDGIKQIANQFHQMSENKKSLNMRTQSQASLLLNEDRFIFKHEDELLDKGTKYQHNKEVRQQLSEQKQRIECTFKPQINKDSTSQEYLKDKPQRENVHVALYEEAKQIKYSREEKLLQQQVDFKNLTEINQKKQMISIKDITERLTNTEKKKATLEKLVEQKNKYQLEIDPMTNQKLFHPIISQYPKSARERSQSKDKENISQSLFQESRLKSNRRDLKREQIEKEWFKKPQLSKNTLQIVNQKRQERVQELFQILDSDQDGLISSQKVDISQLSTKVLDMITPFLVYLEQSNREMKIEDFQQELQIHCLKNLTVMEKEELLGPKRKVKELERKFEFKPELSKTTSQLALSKGRSIGNIYDKLYKEDQTKKKLKQNQILTKQKTEVEQCSFQPIVTSKNNELSSKAKQRYLNGGSKRAVQKQQLPSYQSQSSLSYNSSSYMRKFQSPATKNGMQEENQQ